MGIAQLTKRKQSMKPLTIALGFSLILFGIGIIAASALFWAATPE
jgi:hypothetical protein